MWPVHVFKNVIWPERKNAIETFKVLVAFLGSAMKNGSILEQYILLLFKIEEGGKEGHCRH